MEKDLSRFIIALLVVITLTCPSIVAQEGSPLKPQRFNNGKVSFARVIQQPKSLDTFNKSEWLTNILGLDTSVSFTEIAKYQDRHGMLHIKLQQYYNGIPVEGMIYSLHFSKEGTLTHISGNYSDLTPLFTSPVLTVQDAYQVAVLYMQTEKFAAEMDRNPESNGQLVYIIKNNILIQCYRFEFISDIPLAHSFVYVNSHNASVELEESKLRFGNVPVVVETYFNGTQTILTESVPSAFRLHDYTRGDGIATWNMNYDDDYSLATDFIDSAGTWELSDSDKVALDVHYSMEKSYDFFLEKFGRNSYSGTGSAINSYVHYLENYRNAFYSPGRFVFGDGLGVGSFSEPFTSTDIVAHEYTHGVVSYTANLDYQMEPGALEESFCDIFGIAVDFYANPATANWFMGDRGESYMLRSLKDPNKVGDPDTYQGEYWVNDIFNDNGGVHTNSGVQNYWFYLLSEGGEGYNDNGDYYKVNPIGIDKALDITYQSLTTYLGFNSQYADACFYAIQSAKDIYGECSREVKEVTNAWYAVGLHEPYDTAVLADFDLDQLYYCSTPSVISPINKSLHGTEFEWLLNGTLVSTEETPDITLPSEGGYSLELITNGSYGCWNSDTISLDSIYVKNVIAAPVATSCIPVDTSISLKHIIDSIRVNGQIFTPQPQKGYVDLSCYAQFTAMEGTEFQIEVWHSDESAYIYNYWLDKNNDGSFSEDEALPVVHDSVNYGYCRDSVFVDDVIVNNSPLRLRIMSHAYNDDYCSTLDVNTAHDYGLSLLPNTEPPIARVPYPDFMLGINVKLEMEQNSLHNPTSYEWHFEKGSPDTSFVAEPVVNWDSIGEFDVTLIVSNAFGSDTLFLENYVKVLPTFYMGYDFSTSLTEGILYDSGGDSADYKNNELLDFLVDSPCDSVIEFTIHYADLAYSDYLEVYNNQNPFNASQEIKTGSGLTNYSRIFDGDQLLVRLTSDSVLTDRGFALSWRSLGRTTGQMPVAGFAIEDTVPAWNQPVFLSDTSLFVNKYREWFVNDSLVSGSETFSYRFNKEGVNRIKLNVLNCEGTDSIIDSLTVSGPSVAPPIPSAIEFDIEIGTNLDTCIQLKNTSSETLFLETSVFENDSSTRKQYLGVDIIVTGYSHNYHDSLIAHLSEKGANVRYIAPNVLNADSLENADVLFFKAMNNFSTPIIQKWIADGGHLIMTNDYFSSFYYGSLLDDLGLYLSNYQDLLITGLTRNLDTLHPILKGVNDYEIEFARRYISFSDSGSALVSDTEGHSLIVYKQYHSGSVLMATDDIEENQLYNNSKNRQIIDNYILSQVWKTKVAQYPDQGFKIKSDSTVNACVHINTDNLYEGTYDHTLQVIVNDTQYTTLSIPIRINAIGEGEYFSITDTLDYGTVLVGNSSTLSAIIENVGTDSLIIDSVVVSNAVYEVSLSTNLLPVENNLELKVSYTPVAAEGGIDSLIVYTSNSTSSQHIIYLLSEGLFPPDIQLSESEIELTLTRGETDTVTFSVSNTGNSDLLIDGSFLRRGHSISNIYHSRYLVGVNILVLGASYYSEFVDTLESLGANIHMVSHTELFDTTLLRYTDILVFNYMSNYGVFDHSSGVDTIRLEAIKKWMYNGGSVLIDGYLPYRPEMYAYLMQGSGIESPVSDIAGTYSNIQSHFITYGVDSVYSSEKWFHFSIWGDAEPLLNNDNGEAIIAYSAVGDGQVLVAGCRMLTDNTLINNQNTTFLINAMEYLVGTPVWIKFTEEPDTLLPPGTSCDVSVKIDARFIYSDSYLTILEVYSNDPDESLSSAIIRLNVIEPILEVDDTLRFLNTKLGDQQAAELRIINEANYDITIESFTNSCSEEIVFPQGEMIIKSGQTTKLVFTYIPVDVEEGECTVIMHTTDPNQPQFEIKLFYSSVDTASTAIGAINIENKIKVVPVSADLFKVIANNNQQIESVTVYNSGGVKTGISPLLIDNTAYVELSGYGKGIYILEVSTGKERSIHKVVYH